MNIPELIARTKKPPIYEKGTAFMWTDPHISRQLLDIHLNPDLDLGSRKRSTIDATARWILDTQKEKGKLNVLDLGCGPGLYAERFARQEHAVTGMDISKNSIAHAERSAKDQNLAITYLHASYLEADLGRDMYDLVTLIYTDLGVLLPAERELLLEKIFRALKKGGTFIFDVLSDKEIEKKTSPRTWEAGSHGFWKGSPYLALSESFLYPEEKLILFQHTVADADENMETYRFWTHFFSHRDVTRMLKSHNFTEIRFPGDILHQGDHVIFVLASK